MEGTQSTLWFSKHPVISTMLWLLGNPERDDDEGQELNTDKLTWKDADGANLAEFISEIQTKERGHSSPPLPASAVAFSSSSSSSSSSHASTASVSTNGGSNNSMASRRQKGGLGQVGNTACSSLASLNSTDSGGGGKGTGTGTGAGSEDNRHRHQSDSIADSRGDDADVGADFGVGVGAGAGAGAGDGTSVDSTPGTANTGGEENGLPTPPTKSPDGWGFHVAITPSNQMY